MFELVARGPSGRSIRHTLSDSTLLIGRQAELTLLDDPAISRVHASVRLSGEILEVQKSETARNPIFFRGQPATTFRLSAGEAFVIGETVIELRLQRVSSPLPQEGLVAEQLFDPQSLKQIRYQDPENRLEVLTHLPEVIGGATSESELHHRLSNLMLKGVVHADAAAIVSLDGEGNVRVVHWARRREIHGPPVPSPRMVLQALSQSRNSVLHIHDKQSPSATEHTLASEFDWSICTPVSGLTSGPSGIFLAGRMGPTFVPGTTLSEHHQLEADVKFTELVSEIISAVLKAQKLERQKAGLRQFFAPPILAALGDDLDTTLLEPCECEVTVLFCDLRGFSQHAEMASNDLIGLLTRVSDALGVMTSQILAHGGVTGDFQGDAALGFWGWPFPSPDSVIHACQAALGIRAAFRRAALEKKNPLANFAMGIGIAHGRAVAGKIGTADQVKVTVFGPTVNLASRLETMTKQLRVPIVVDEATVEKVRPRLDSSVGRIRCLGRVQPYGLEIASSVYELLPPEVDLPELTNEHLQQYEEGVRLFVEGSWEEAYRMFHRMPPSDCAQDFLIQHITQHGRIAPAGWDGILRLPSK